jgi:hypothetical protein
MILIGRHPNSGCTIRIQDVDKPAVLRGNAVTLRHWTWRVSDADGNLVASGTVPITDDPDRARAKAKYDARQAARKRAGEGRWFWEKGAV